MATIQIDQERLTRVEGMRLGGGAHASIERGLCIMEAVSFVAGERWSDHPKCACPVIGAFVRAWNDGLPDGERDTLLKPYIARLVGTRSTKAVERRRADLALDWMVRVHAPAWLDLSEALSGHATAMRALSPLTSKQACLDAQPVLDTAAAQSAAARDAAWAAAWAAARAAAWAAAWDAAWDAIKNMDVSHLTSGLAGDAARSACVALFAPTRATLQRSALELLEAMIAVTPESLSS